MKTSPAVDPTLQFNDSPDRTNMILAACVAIVTGIVYSLTVQPTVSFWDCGEFIACSYILGIPHPPGSPLFIIIGRLFSVLPVVADVALRVNLLSVISSALTAMFGYLVVQRMIRLWYPSDERNQQTRLIGYVGGLTGAFFLAFSRTNWGNAVEAEVYGLTMMLTLVIFWLALKFYEHRGEKKALRYMALAIYLGMLGIGIHMAAFLVIPVAAIFFVIKKDADKINWIYLCSFFVIELLLILLISFGEVANGYKIFLFISTIMFVFLALKLYHNINLPLVLALASVGGIMLGFWPFVWGIVGATLAVIAYSRFNRRSNWRSAIAMMMLAVMGFSVNLFIPIRSSVNPRVDENNPSKSFTTFVDFLERKQYGSMSMTERMFKRRGVFENQFGRHPHMGYWSYFEEQYSPGRVGFIPIFLLGMFGVYFMMRRRLEVGYPFLIMLLLGSVGLILYMNFADGVMYNRATNDAYLEVRNRDYFFTTAFIFFGLAIGLGVAGIMEVIRNFVAESARKTAVFATSALGLLSFVPLQHNWFVSDRSNNYLPYDYANNILQTVPQNGILFTSGDNDTFPLWCLQEAYRVRRDIKIANLSLLNTDWYVEQMKNRIGIPMELSDSQIVWETFEGPSGQVANRPPLQFFDRARQRRTFLNATVFNGRVVKVQDMMVDEIALSAKFENVTFTSEPYAESPLRLRSRKEAVGVINILNREPAVRLIDVDQSYDLYMNKYHIRELDNPAVYKDDNATGVLVSFGFGVVRIYNEYSTLMTLADRIDSLKALKDTPQWTNQTQLGIDSLTVLMDGHDPADKELFGQRIVNILEKMTKTYPEFWMSYILLSDYYRDLGDTATALKHLRQGEENLQLFMDYSPDNANYMQDLGLLKHEIVRVNGGEDPEGLDSQAYDLLWAGFRINMNSGMSYQKLIQFLSERRLNQDIVQATRDHARYKLNYYNNPFVKSTIDQYGGLTFP